MNMKKRGLGKGLSDLGLSALLGDLQTAPTSIRDLKTSTSLIPEPVAELSSLDGQLKKLPIQSVKPGKYQPRKILSQEGLEELSQSIRQQGVIQPIVVRSIGQNQYEIIAGERRWRAAQLAELNYIPAIIREISDETAIVLALIENIQRRDLNAMEEAFALNRMITEFQMTHEAIADAVGKSRVAVTNLLRLLKLNPTVRHLVETEQLEMGHARALLALDESRQTQVANTIISQQLSVRETEDFIRKMSSQHPQSANNTASKTILYAVQDRLKQSLGTKVVVSQNAAGRGKLVIYYKNGDELERILEKI